MNPTLRLFLLLLMTLLPLRAQAQAAAPEYRIGPGDVLKVQVWGEDDLSRAFPVNEQGQLDFPFVGLVSVGGQTTVEAAAALRDRLQQGYLLQPEVTVWVESFGSQPVQVLGAVARPGLVFVSGPTTLLEVLGQVGGVSNEGVDEIRLTRGGEGGTPQVFSYEALRSEGAGSALVLGGDIVFVPDSQVHVLGEVIRPGPIAYREGMTLSRYISEAGGAAAVANLGRVWILRDDQRIRVNLRKVLRGKAEDVVVQSGDRIFVGESVL